MANIYDLVVIGSGPAGYIGAIRGAQLGLKTAVIEKDKTFGGTCLNVGCIPSKALLESSEHFQFAQHDFAKHGIKAGSIELDLPTMLARKDKVVKDLTQGVAFLFKKNKIETHAGLGKILTPENGINRVEVKKSDGTVEILNTKNVMICTGSVPVELPFLKFDEKKIVSSTGALVLSQVPKHLVVVGGGVIGLEMASVWSRLGAKVTVIEFADAICSMMDQETVQVLTKSLSKEGVVFKTSCKVIESKMVGDQVHLVYENMKSKQNESIEGDVVLVATGRKPFTEGLGLENVGIEKDQRGYILIDDHLKTTAPGIFAVGDVVRGPMLAHKAEEEGVAVAEYIANGFGHVNYNTVPSVIYTHPEVASVGLSEDQAKAQGIAINVGKFPFMANGRAKAKGSTDGFVKIIADQKTDRILGGHIVGPSASELLGEIVVTMEFGGSSEDLGRSFHSHPTLSEVVREAALAVEKRARQM
ncbi:MAG: dihydrolipoyl dehydrogenase [Pseudobdellovibrionaceae bacterium]